MQKQWQPPKYWQDFERMCHLLFRQEHKATQSYLYGRQGQAQYGVDIALRKPQTTRWIGIQCKLKTEILGASLSEQELVDAYQQSCGFQGGLEELYVATTCERDRNVQDRARVVSESWQARHPITVCFWDDIEDLLERHPSVASSFYPEAFAPQNSLYEREDGDLSISLAQKDFTARLAIFFDHAIFRSSTGIHRSAVMTIVSELVDNLFAAGKGGATRVRVVLSGQVLTVSDDGVSFDSLTATIRKENAGGITAIRSAIARSGGQLTGHYVAKDAGDSVYNTMTLKITPASYVLTQSCSAAGPAEYLLSRDDASRFVRALAIPDDCESFTLRLYSAGLYANFSATSQLLHDLRQRLAGRVLTLKVGQDCERFLPALQSVAMAYADIAIDYV